MNQGFSPTAISGEKLTNFLYQYKKESSNLRHMEKVRGFSILFLYFGLKILHFILKCNIFSASLIISIF